MSDAVLQTTIKAFDEFTSQFQKFQSELKKTEKTTKETAQGTDQMNRSASDFFKTIGELGALYAFQRGLKDIIGSGREFELTIKQAQAVTGDFSSTLRNLAMATKGGNLDTFGPTQLAQAYRELGAAGASTNDIMAATPDILEFGSAALLDMDQAAFSVLSTAKSFNIALSDSGQIVDAYTQAMNQGALAGEDFQWIMSSAGAVAKMTGQDFREILSIGSAMRDSGIQAQDAGTAIKSALMALMNPSDQARKAMKDLGISIYDSSGQMKQWSDITAEFEQALKPLDQQSQQLALSTIFGADGIRTMAVSMNKGSDYLRTFTEGLKNADGATHSMAEAMSDTYDGAAKKFNASLERTKILLFEDIAPAAGVALGALNTLLLGIQSTDEGTRKFIEILVGGAGLVIALGAVTTAIKTVLPLLEALGIGTSALAGPIGIVIGLIGAATTAFLAYKGAAAQATLEESNHIKTLEGQVSTIPALVKQYDELGGKANRTASEEESLKQVTSQLTEIMPEAISGFDNFGNALFNAGTLADQAKGKVSSLKTEIANYYQMQADSARINLNSTKDKLKPLLKEREEALKAFGESQKSGPIDAVVPFNVRLRVFGKDTGLKIKQLAKGSDLKELIDYLDPQVSELQSQVIQMEQSIAIADKIKDGSYWDKPTTTTDNNPPPGGNTFTTSSGTKNPGLEAAKSLTEAVDTAISPYKNAVELAGIAVDSLSSKEQFLSQMLEGGNGTAADAIALNQTRAEQLAKLSDQQEALRQQSEMEKAALGGVREKLSAANDPDVVKELESEVLNLQKSIAQTGQAWIQAEQQKVSLLNKVKQEEDKRYSDAYQKAMELMRHQVNMAAMSTGQQIEYLEKLRAAHEWTQQQMWEMEESLYSLRKQQLSEMLDKVEDEYKSSLDVIESRVDTVSQSIQSQIDALEQRSQANTRADAQVKYNQKIQELQEKRHYHELRTGQEHADAILEIDKELSEAKREWELQQQEWSIDDQKENLQKKLDQAKEEGDKEKKLLQEQYQKAQKIAESGVMDIIAALAATEPQWMDTGKQLVDALISGMKSGDFSSVQRLVDNVRSSAPTSKTEPDSSTFPSSGGNSTSGSNSQQTPLWSIPKGAYRMYGGTTGMKSRDLASLLGESVSWDQAQGQVTIGGKSFGPLENDHGTTYVSIRQVAEALGYRVTWNDPNVDIYKAGKGGIFTQPALSMMAEAGGSEVAMPLDRLQPMMNIALVEAMKNSQSIDSSIFEYAINRIVAAIERKGGIQINGPALNIERGDFSNKDGLEDSLRVAVSSAFSFLG